MLIAGIIILIETIKEGKTLRKNYNDFKNKTNERN